MKKRKERRSVSGLNSNPSGRSNSFGSGMKAEPDEGLSKGKLKEIRETFLRRESISKITALVQEPENTQFVGKSMSC